MHHFPPLKIVIVEYVAAILLLWVLTLILSPQEYKFSFFRGFIAAFLMAFFGNAALLLLNPLIGDWQFLVMFAARILVVMAILKLKFWRSTLIALIYTVCGAIAAYFLFPEVST